MLLNVSHVTLTDSTAKLQIPPLLQFFQSTLLDENAFLFWSRHDLLILSR